MEATKEIYLYKNGIQIGPFPKEDILQKLKKNELNPDDLAWPSESEEWVAVESSHVKPCAKDDL